MSVRTDRVQVEVEIGGQKAGATINELQKSYKQLNRELNQLAIGSDAYNKKAEELKGVKSKLADVKKEVHGIQQANGGLIQSWMQMTPFNSQFQALSGTLKGGQTNVLGLSKGFTTLRGAIISTGIGALIVVLGSLISYLTTTQAGIDQVTRVTAPLSAIFERLKGVVQVLGERVFKGLAEAIKNPKQALADLVEFMKNQVINRFEAIGMMGKAVMRILSGEFDAGLKDLADAGAQYVTGVEGSLDKIANAAKGAAEWVKEGVDLGLQIRQMTIDIEKAEINLTTQRAKLNAEFERAKEIAQDQSRTEKERIEAARQAQAAQNELLGLEQRFIDMKVKKLELEQTLNDTSREGHKEMAELEAQRTQLEADASRKRASAKNLENSITKQGLAEQKKLHEQAAKEAEERRKIELKAAEDLEDMRISVMRDGIGKQIAEIELTTARKIEKLQGTEAQITEATLLLEQERAQKIEELKKEEAEKAAAAKLERFNTSLALDRQALEIEILALEEQYARKLLTDEEYYEQKHEAEHEALLSRMERLRAFHGEESLEYQTAKTALAKIDEEAAARKVATAQRAADQEQKIKEGLHNATTGLLELGIELLGKDEEARKKHGNKLKALAIAQISLNLIEEVSSIWKRAADLPVPLNIVVGVAQSAVAVGRAGLAMNKVSSTQYAKGGVFGGSLHSQGGNPVIDGRTGEVIAEVEAGEPYMILSRDTYRNNGPIIDALLDSSMHQGGRPIFESGGVMNPYRAASTAAATGGSAGTKADVIQDYGPQIIARLDAINSTMSGWSSSLKAYVVYNEFEAAADEMEQIRADAQVK